LSLATLNSTNQKIKDFELIAIHKKICKVDYSTNVNNRIDNSKVTKKKKNSSISSNADKDTFNYLTKLRELENFENDEFSDENQTLEKGNISNPFKSIKNPNTASKGLPPKSTNVFASNKKIEISSHNYTANKNTKISDFNHFPTSRASFKITNDNKFSFKEKIEMAARMPFAVKKENIETSSNINFSTEKDIINFNYEKQFELNKKNDFKKVINEVDRMSEKNENFDSASIKLDSNISELNYNNNHNNNNNKTMQNPFKKLKFKNNYTSGHKIFNNYSSNYASNIYMSNFNSNMKEASEIYKTNDNNYKSNYDTYDMRETINENSNITSVSIISNNMDFDSHIRSDNLDKYNGDSNNIKTNDIYGSNSFAEFTSENAIDIQFGSNLSKFDPNCYYKSNYKNFKNDFDNYEEYESAMRKIELGTKDYLNKANNKNVKKNNKNTHKTEKRKRISNNSNNNNATESDYISDISKNSRVSSNSQINNYSYITKSSISDIEL
jgi:hypothetical protein